MRKVIGIDVSKNKLNYYLIDNDGLVEDSGVVTNDLSGLEKLFEIINDNSAEAIFKATGVYSQKLQYFLELNDVNYVLMNPLQAKKEMDTLRANKTDEIDAKKLAILQMEKKFDFTVRDELIYQNLRWEHRFYQEVIDDLVRAKNRLQRSLQMTFSEIDSLYVGENELLYEIVKVVPHTHMVAGKNIDDVVDILKPVFKRTGKVLRTRAEKLLYLANNTSVAVDLSSSLVDQVIYWAEQIIELNDKRRELIKEMIDIASELNEFDIIRSIPGFGDVSAVGLIAELGNIRKFKTSQKMNAFVGIDLRFSDSGQYKTRGFITKRGNGIARKILYRITVNVIAAAQIKHDPNPVSRWYSNRTSNETHGKKKILVGAMDRTLKLIYLLVKNNEEYNYQK